jgi:diketogulonate reductase-like aldo/keto reductase
MKNLGLDYLDLYLVHWPMGFKEHANMGPFPKDDKGNILFSDVHYLEPYKVR